MTRYNLLFRFFLITHIASSTEMEVHSDSTITSPAVHAPSLPEPLSWSPRVFRIPNFLSKTETAWFRHQAQQSKDFKNESSFNSVYFNLDDYFKLNIVRSVEDRIAAVTGIKPHPDQEALCIHRILPVSTIMSARTIKDNQRKAKNLGLTYEEFCDQYNVDTQPPLSIEQIHHDKNNKHWTTVTMVAYLANTEEGGHTIFPCTENSVKSSCLKAFNFGARWYNGKRTVIEGKQVWAHKMGGEKKKKNKREKTLINKDLDKLLQGTSAACDSMTHWPDALRVEPKEGDAIFFWHDHVGESGSGVGDPMAWHTGCGVRKGTKWTLQKFMELPVGSKRKQ